LADNEQAAAPAAAPNPADQPPPSAPTPEQAAVPEGQQPAPEGEDDEDDDDASDKPKSRSAERREARKRQIEADRRELAALRAEREAARQPMTLEERIGKPPNWADYRGDQISYAADMAAYKTAKQWAASSMAAEQKQQTASQQARWDSIQARAAELENQFASKVPDYNQAMQAIQYVNVPPVALEAIAESDLRPQILYHLGKNPEKAFALSRMTPKEAVKEIGRLEERLSAVPAARTSTQAPPPPSALKGGAAGPAKNLADMSMDEYVAARRAGRRG